MVQVVLMIVIVNYSKSFKISSFVDSICFCVLTFVCILSISAVLVISLLVSLKVVHFC